MTKLETVKSIFLFPSEITNLNILQIKNPLIIHDTTSHSSLSLELNSIKSKSSNREKDNLTITGQLFRIARTPDDPHINSRTIKCCEELRKLNAQCSMYS